MKSEEDRDLDPEIQSLISKCFSKYVKDQIQHSDLAVLNPNEKHETDQILNPQRSQTTGIDLLISQLTEQ